MKILNIEEQENGCAILTIDLDSEELHSLVEFAFIEILKKQLKDIIIEQHTEPNEV